MGNVCRAERQIGPISVCRAERQIGPISVCRAERQMPCATAQGVTAQPARSGPRPTIESADCKPPPRTES